MKILFCGDVVGRSGREVVIANLPRLRRELALDFVVVNGENAAHGFGITKEICRDFYAADAMSSPAAIIPGRRRRSSPISTAIRVCCGR
jgi:calcineurin-like phosphoesterase